MPHLQEGGLLRIQGLEGGKNLHGRRATVGLHWGLHIAADSVGEAAIASLTNKAAAVDGDVIARIRHPLCIELAFLVVRPRADTMQEVEQHFRLLLHGGQQGRWHLVAELLVSLARGQLEPAGDRVDAALVVLANEEFPDRNVLVSQLVDRPVPVVDRLVDE